MSARKHEASTRWLALAALGVVFGDIGTSTLYALREALPGGPPSDAAVLGVLSLVIWALVVIVSIKYLVLVLRADNDGEGGILALMALVLGTDAVDTRVRKGLLYVGLLGAALLYGDGIITPAISVLSAMEGLDVVAPSLAHLAVPLAAAILVGLYLVQARGTGKIGRVFGPIMLVWFAAIAVLGAVSIVQAPAVLAAFDPSRGVSYLIAEPSRASAVLGGVFLVVTGGEALYADLGHFGRLPIRLSWTAIVLPALLLSYLGQGALLLRDPGLVTNPFFHLAPEWGRVPLLILATLATIIASQAVISGAFSLTMQAVQLGFLPRVSVRHTSQTEYGQVYVPLVNFLLCVASVTTVVAFGSSDALAGAYGVAVSTTMVITTALLFFAMFRRWRWPLPVAGLVALAFLAVDLTFLLANVEKIPDGGWLPLALGGLVVVIMATWRTGARAVAEGKTDTDLSLAELRAEIEAKSATRLPGTAVLLHPPARDVPSSLVRLYRFTSALHERNIFLAIAWWRIPFIHRDRQFNVEDLGGGFYRVVIRLGYLDRPQVPALLEAACRESGLEVDLAEVIYVLEHDTIVPKRGGLLAIWRKKLFVFLERNGAKVSDYYHLPSERVLELGAQVDL